MRIVPALKKDLPAILELQYLAYQSEAKLVGSFDIPPLKQTLEDIECEFLNRIFLKAIDDQSHIIGSVRGYVEEDTLHIGKLIVHPDFQGHGIGTELLRQIELACPQQCYELFTSDKSSNNLRLYERLGYVRFKSQQVSPYLSFIYLEKVISRDT